MYHRLNNEFFAISDHKHKSATKQRLNLSKNIINQNIIALQNNRVCFCFLCKQEPQSTKKSVACIYTDEHGLKKLQCSYVQVLWVAYRNITISGDVEKNPGSFTRTNNDKNVSCTKSVNSVSLLEFRLTELGIVPANVLGDGNCFFRTVSYQLCNSPEWYIESNYEQSWENYVNNMARQGTWADNIIIQAVANSLNVTINIIESNAIFSPVTIVNPVNTDGQTTNIYIGHIQEYHCVSTMPALSLITPEITCDSGLIKKSVSSHEDRVEHCKESHFSQKKQSQLANEEKDDRR